MTGYLCSGQYAVSVSSVTYQPRFFAPVVVFSSEVVLEHPGESHLILLPSIATPRRLGPPRRLRPRRNIRPRPDQASLERGKGLREVGIPAGGSCISAT
jgi:hypothetical protein